MIIFPAIDIHEGKCVRLEKGDFNKATHFNDDVVAQAKEFEDAGFKWLHVVDLDGAKRGNAVNSSLILDIKKNTKLKIQVGGGIRDIKTIEKYIDGGIDRVIIGTMAVDNFPLLEEICKKYPGKIAVGVDSIGNKVATEGWQKESDMYVFDLISKLEEIGVSAIIYTDISKDGLLSGFDEAGSKEIAKNLDIPLIISGGVTTTDDLVKVSEMVDSGIEGAIIGRSFYEKRISYKEALSFERE
jgi:phosphoribosylformimino-5-aminoimidazole carboxamide ribotide isomerase